MTNRSWIAVLTIGPALWLSAITTGCAGTPPPKEQIASAETLVKRAEQEGAGQYAPRPLREAKDKIEKAQSEVNDDDNDNARRLAEEAEADAKLAVVEADRGKTKESFDELTRTVQALEKELASPVTVNPSLNNPRVTPDPLVTPEVK